MNIQDITIVASAFGSKPGDVNWNAVADLNDDEVINIRDIVKVALDFGKEAYHCMHAIYPRSTIHAAIL